MTKGWQLDAEGKAFALQVILLKQEYVLPWVQFLYAEGAEDSIRAVFSTHDVLVQGNGLTALLADFASQRVSVLRQPSRSDVFTSTAGPHITAVDVRRVEQQHGAGL